MLTTPPDDRDRIRSQNRGSRTYSIGGRSLPSVTSIVGDGEPKPVLVNWAKKVTAEAAVTQHKLVGQLIEQDGEKAAIDHLKGAAYRQRDAAGELGSKLHEVAEYEILMGKPYPEPGDPAAQRLLTQFRNFCTTMDPEWHAIEAIVYSETAGYAGTLDAIGSLHPQKGQLNGYAHLPLLIDWKSGSGVYGSHALQLSAYAHAEFLIGPNGEVHMDQILPEPKAAVVHITPQGWSLVEVDVSDQILDVFLLCKGMQEWTRGELADTAVGATLAHGKATGGKALKVGGQSKAPDPQEVAQGFGQRRRIKPPSLTGK